MTRDKLLRLLAKQILGIQKNLPVLVGIDGVDASGKTTLANELAEYLKDSNRNIIRTSIDGFHNPEKVRYAQGRDSAKGYYYDSFNYQAITSLLLDPLSSGKLEYQTANFDYRVDSELVSSTQQATNDSILIMEGVFLFRPELVRYWDFKIFLDVDFKFTLQRALKRQAEKDHLGSEQQIIDKYNNRYIAGQKLYFREANPKTKADIIIDNTRFETPRIIKSLKTKT